MPRPPTCWRGPTRTRRHLPRTSSCARGSRRVWRSWLSPLVEAEPVRSRIDQDHLAAVTRAVPDSGVEERVVLRAELLVERVDAVDLDQQRGAGGAVVGVRREVEDQLAARDLEVDRAVALTVLPIEPAAEVVEVEPPGGSEVEHPEDRDSRLNRHAHEAETRTAFCNAPSASAMPHGSAVR